jgi:hypothetical protein
MKSRQKKVQRAYLYDNFYPFNGPVIRHVLVDENCVFIPTYGWVGKENLKQYRVFPIGNSCMMWDLDRDNDYKWWGKYWEENEAWAWCYMKKVPQFVFCRVEKSEDGYTIYAA